MKKLFVILITSLSFFCCNQLVAMQANESTEVCKAEAYPDAPKAYQDILQKCVQVIADAHAPGLIIPSFLPIRLDNRLNQRTHNLMIAVDGQIYVDPQLFGKPYGAIKTVIGKAVISVLQSTNHSARISALLAPGTTWVGSIDHEATVVAICLLGCPACLKEVSENRLCEIERDIFDESKCKNCSHKFGLAYIFHEGESTCLSCMDECRKDAEKQEDGVIELTTAIQKLIPESLCTFHERYTEIFCSTRMSAPLFCQQLLTYGTQILKIKKCLPVMLTERLRNGIVAQIDCIKHQIMVTLPFLKLSYGAQKIVILHELAHLLQPIDSIGLDSGELDADMRALRDANCYECVLEFAEVRSGGKLAEEYLKGPEIMVFAQTMDHDQLCEYHKEYRKRLGDTKIHPYDWLSRRLKLGDVEDKIARGELVP